VSERLRSKLITAGVALLFAAPLAVLLVQAFADSWRAPAVLPQALGSRGFEVAFGSGGAGEALANSIVVALTVTTISIVVGWPAARVLGRRRLSRNGLVLLLIAIPLLMPPFLAGFGLTEWFIRLGIDDSLAGLILAHVTFALPYAILILLSGFSRELESLEEMASTVGASPGARLRWVTVPALRPTLAAAGLLCFLVSFSQYGSSLAVGAGRPTLPIVLLPFVQSDAQVAAALALVFLAPCVMALVVASRLQRNPL